jgi:competence protein ComEC
MIRWTPYTFVRITFCFIAGILCGIFFPDLLTVNFAVILLCSVLLIYIIAFFVFPPSRNRWVNHGYIALPGIFLAGMLHVFLQNDARNEMHILNLGKDFRYYRAVVSGYAQEKEKSWKVTADITEIKDSVWTHAEGKVVLYFPKQHFTTAFNYGDVLLIKGKPHLVPSPANPGEFDFKKYLSYNNTFNQHFIKKAIVIFEGNKPANIVKYYALRTRIWAQNALNTHLTDQQSRGIASALILGITDGLDNELLSAYSATGSMHILAVSGLHISIIYLIIVFVLKGFVKDKKSSWVLALISLTLLWCYAFITGLSPSVLRAVTMFSFLAVARSTSRTTNIYNTLAASGFCLLMFDPFLIMSVGFQLSYLAVIGIVYIEPLMANWIEPRSWLMNEVWKITRVSIAAQLATMSLGLLYFHQFPNYFLLSNLIAIPLSFVVLILGLALIAFSFIPVVAHFLGVVVELGIKSMNAVIEGIEWLPYSVVDNIHITNFQSWMLMGTIACIILTLQKKNVRYFYAAASFATLLTIAQWSYFHLNNFGTKLTVYNVPGHTAIDYFVDGKAYFISDTLITQSAGKISYHIKPNRVNCGISNHDIFTSFAVRHFNGGKIYRVNDKNILQISSGDFNREFLSVADFVILANDALSDFDILRNSKNLTVIFDSSNSYYYVNRMLNENQSLNIKVHSVLHHGAFEFTFDNT